MANRFLFIRLSALGDVVNTLPALVALRRARPDAEIDWLVEDRFADLVQRVDGVRRVIVFPRKDLSRPTPSAAAALFRHLRELRRETYDVAIDFQGNLKGALQLRAARAGRRIGAVPARESAERWYGERAPIVPDLPRAARAIALVHHAVGHSDLPFEPATPRLDRRLLPLLRVDKAAAGRVDSALGIAQPPERPLVLVHPGTSRFGAFKRWPCDRFAAAAAGIREATGADVRITCGPGEEDLARAVIALTQPPVSFVPPGPSIADLIELLRRAALLVAADSGPLHLAAALDVPCVALFGPKDPVVYAPPWEHVRVVRRPPPCSPCKRRACDDPICMTELPIDPVIEAATELLRRDQPVGAPPVRR